MANPRLSIIIVNYNVKEFLEQALQSIQKATVNLDAEVFVVDNHSVDESVKMVRRKYPWVQLIVNEQNAGFAAANNQALQQARGDYLLVLNPDTLVQEDTFATMIDYLDEHPDVGMAGCKILNPDGTLQLACRRSFPTLRVALPKIFGLSRLFPRSKVFGKYNLTYLDPDQETSVDAVSGSFMMVRSKAMEQVGLLDESFFMYGEDLDWCYRFKQAGWDIKYVPDTKIIHYKGESSKYAAFDSFITFYRAMDLFVKKHFGSRWTFIFHFFIRLGIFFRATVGLVARGLESIRVQLLDLVLILVGFLFAILVKFGNFSYVLDYSFLPIVYSLIWISALVFTRSYSGRQQVVSRTLSGLVLGFIIITSLTFFFNQFAYSRAVLLIAFIFALITLPGWRIIQQIRHGASIGEPIRQRRALIVGAGEEGERIREKLETQISHGYQVIGYVDENSENEVSDGILGGSREISDLVRVHKITDVIFTSDVYRNIDILAMVDQLKNHPVELKIVPHSLEYILGKATVEHIADLPFVELEYPLYQTGNRILKRFADILFALILIPILFPICFTVAAIKRYQLSTAEFPGENESTFHASRFLDNSGESGKCGWTPLLWNVFKGDMSIVGMPLEKEVAPDDHLLYKPGLLSLWTVESGNAGEKRQYNHYYMQNYSLAFDIQILLRALLRKNRVEDYT